MKRVLITGASGFVATALCRSLRGRGHSLTLSSRRALDVDEGVRHVVVGSIGRDSSWETALDNVDVVIHTAARVHVMNETVSDPLAEFRRVNVEGTLSLARQAVALGARRFIYISSIKVNGECTPPEIPFTLDALPAPLDPYGVSKREAEDALRALALETGIEVVIIRPPLVYGPGVKANFLSMMRWLKKGLPLPLGAIRNRRSLVALDNLNDLICLCVTHADAANRTFLVSDGEDLSTTELLNRMAAALGVPARLLPVPAPILELGATVLGRRAVAQRLCASLQVDISETCRILGWVPPLSVDEGLRKTAGHFLETERF